MFEKTKSKQHIYKNLLDF